MTSVTSAFPRHSERSEAESKYPSRHPGQDVFPPCRPERSPEGAKSKDLSLRTLLKKAATRLASAGIDTPEHDAKLLLAEAIGCELRDIDKAMLMGESVEEMLRLRPPAFAQHDGKPEQPSAQHDSVAGCHPERSPEGAESKDLLSHPLVRFEAMVARRTKREPLQYIVGHAPFRWLDLKVGPGVFIPRPETEAVVQAGLDWLAAHSLATPRMVDLCAGSGAIGLSIATEVPGAEVWAVELAEKTIAWTRRNAVETLGCDEIPSKCAAGEKSTSFGQGRYHLLQGDATAAETLAELDGTVDAVITNPPYVPLAAIPEQPEVRDHDPALALYGGSDDGLRIPERIIDRAACLLRPGGLLVMEHDITQGVALVSYAKAAGFSTARTGQDWTGRDRFLTACLDS